MFANMNDWKSDRTAEAQGVSFAIGQGRELIVRRAGSRNRAYMAGLASLDAEDIRSIEKLWATTIVCGWRGLIDEHGHAIPYSPEACMELFAQCPDLGDHVARFATDRANYHAQEIQKDADSLKATPAGVQA